MLVCRCRYVCKWGITCHQANVAVGLGIALISRVAIDIELETKRLVMLDVEGFRF